MSRPIRHDIHLVVGAGGYLGRALVRQARAAGLPVRALVRDEAAFRRRIPDPGVAVTAGDPADREVLRRAMVGVGVVHFCAADTGRGGAGRTRARIRAVIDAAARQDAQLIHAGHVAVYGAGGPGILDEEAPLRGRGGTLARVHRPAEMEILAAARERGLRATRLRLLPLIGAPLDPGADRRTLARIARGAWLLDPIRGGRLVAYLDRRDAARCALLAAEHPAAVDRAFNVVGDEPIARDVFLGRAARVAGAPLRRIEIPPALLALLERVQPRYQDLHWLAGDARPSGRAAAETIGYRPAFAQGDSLEEAFRRLRR